MIEPPVDDTDFDHAQAAENRRRDLTERHRSLSAATARQEERIRFSNADRLRLWAKDFSNPNTLTTPMAGLVELLNDSADELDGDPHPDSSQECFHIGDAETPEDVLSQHLAHPDSSQGERGQGDYSAFYDEGERIRRLLKNLEWDGDRCPSCLSEEGPFHHDDCELVAILALLPGEPEE